MNKKILTKKTYPLGLFSVIMVASGFAASYLQYKDMLVTSIILSVLFGAGFVVVCCINVAIE